MNSTLSLLSHRWWLIPVLVVVTGGSVGVNLGDAGDFHPARAFVGGAAAVVLAVLSAVVLFAIDRWPLGVVANGVSVGAYFAVGGENGPVFFTIVVAAFLVASRRRFREWWPLLLASGVLVWAGLVIRGVRWDELDIGIWQSVGVGALVSAAASIATAIRTREEAHRVERRRAATEEQLRMAQDLHDGVGHGLAVIAMQSGVALHVLERDPAAARDALEAIRTTSKEALDALRAELSQITGTAVESAPRTPRRGLDELDLLLDRVRAGGLHVEVVGSGDHVDASTSEAAYAIIQEALTNVLRHAGATAVTVALSSGHGAFVVAIDDDGRGGVVHDEGMGLRGMRERVGGLGGMLEAGPTDRGFRVRATFPPAGAVGR
ncbi:sensor histidine kinase [Nocardioides sp. JQ2195]|uniref:sensor histidine kinase n=1 Tax=Nocardioides sp. JQ2195 TaxID=2592334 RepID=UPI00143E9C82|nr:histidine kinase [Nocardioides sp. JQ2195]QIX28036.1 sensor histidine kinase [Nocardioides sp. JQ2195]